MDALKPGDVVALRSGGPKMTILRAAEPAPALPGISDLMPEPFRPDWIVTWTIRGALREAPEAALKLVEANGVAPAPAAPRPHAARPRPSVVSSRPD